VSGPSGGSSDNLPEDASREAPQDVVTGFWLWAVALPLMLIAYVVSTVSTPGPTPAWLVNAMTAVFAVNTAAVVAAFLILMRRGYRWARTALTGGAAASVVFSVSNLLESDAPAAVAVVFAVAAIVGSVLIVGGMYLLHRKDAHDYFGR
jgi:hypothetical protein